MKIKQRKLKLGCMCAKDALRVAHPHTRAFTDPCDQSSAVGSLTAHLSSKGGEDRSPAGLNQCDTCSRPAPGVSSAPAGSALRSAGDTRVLALELQRAPIPDLSKGEVAARWRVGSDTVRKILGDVGVDYGGGKDRKISLTIIMLHEEFVDPLETWIFAGPDGRRILSADLLTLEEWLAQAPGKAQRDKTKYYRELADGRLASIRIGNQHRFRPTLETALNWHSARLGARS